MIPHIREGVIEFLRYPDEPFRESDLVMDRLISRLHKPLLHHKWCDRKMEMWDVTRIFRDLRLYRTHVRHPVDIQIIMFYLIMDLQTGNTLVLTIRRLEMAKNSSLAREVKNLCDWHQEYQSQPGVQVNMYLPED